MPEIILGDGFAIDANVATKRTVLLGQPESGKTNGATVIAEGLLKLGVPVTVLDWKGDLWGMRSSADGQSEGFPIVIFGGDHADVDIDEADGREIGALVAKEEMPAVIDLSGFGTDTQRRRFGAAFLRAFLQAKKNAVRPHTLLIDEFQQFAPQHPHGEGVSLLSATEQVLGLGRKRGIGVIGTALRAAQLNKNVVEISDLYLFMQIAGKNDVKSIVETLQTRATAEEIAEIRQSIPRLQKGEVVAYSPAWLRILQQQKFRIRETFDSSQTPQVGGEALVAPRAFAKIDAPALSARIAETREAREAEDPELLRARIAQLEKRVSERGDLDAIKAHQATADSMQRRAEAAEGDWRAAITERDYAFAYTLALKNGLRDVILLAEKTLESLGGIAPGEPAQGAVHDNRSADAQQRPSPATRVVTAKASDASALPRVPKSPDEPGTEKITPACVRILTALAQRDPKPLSRRALGFLCGQSPKSSSYTNNLSWLNARGYIRRVADGELELTSIGKAVVPNVGPPATSAAMHAEWLPRFVPAQRRILETLLKAWPKVVDRESLARLSEASPTSSSFANNLAALNSIGVIERVAAGLRAHDDMFPTGKPR
jgi:hypothetical protein